MDDFFSATKEIWGAIGPIVTAVVAVGTFVVNRRVDRAKLRITRIEGDAALLDLVEKSKNTIAHLTEEAERAAVQLGVVLKHVDKLERYADETDRVIDRNRLRGQVRLVRPRLKGHQ